TPPSRRRPPRAPEGRPLVARGGSPCGFESLGVFQPRRGRRSSAAPPGLLIRLHADCTGAPAPGYRLPPLRGSASRVDGSFSPVVACHSRISPKSARSPPTLASVLPSRANATPSTHSLCPYRATRICPVATSHRWTSLNWVV